MKNLKLLGIGLSASVFVAGFVASTTIRASDEIPLSGFLGDYSKLEVVETKGDEELRRWVTSSDIQGLYPSVFIESIVFYPKPEPSDQVSAKVLHEVQAYTDAALSRELAKSYKVVDRVGPNIARVRIAITGLSTEGEKMHAYELIPFAAIASGIKSAAGKRKQEVFLLFEGEVTDSVTGEKLGIAVRKVPGKQLLKDESQQLTLDMMKPVIDDKASNARKIFDAVLK